VVDVLMKSQRDGKPCAVIRFQAESVSKREERSFNSIVVYWSHECCSGSGSGIFARRYRLAFPALKPVLSGENI